MPRKSKSAILDAQRRKPLTVDEWINKDESEELDFLHKETQTLIEKQHEILRKQQELEESRRVFEQQQKELEERTARIQSYMKLGAPMDMSKSEKKLIHINIPDEMYDKLLVARECYHDGLSGYIRYLIEQDMDENFEKYKMFVARERTRQKGGE